MTGPDQPRRPDRPALLLAAVAGAALLALAAWLWLAGPDRERRPLAWEDLAPPASTPMRPWRTIVIHHSDARRGTVEGIDAGHRKRGWDGIGYHFVVGNGVDMPLGQVRATFRWQQQREGAHAGSKPAQTPFNQTGIGICLIGRFDEDDPDPWQLERTAELCALLIRHTPTLSVGRIIGHRDVPGKDTRCPGSRLDLDRLRHLVRERLERTQPATGPAP